MTTDPTAPDPIDDVILERLRQNARESAAAIARDVNLTAGAVRRRIARLEQRGVISRYTIGIEHDKVGASVEAYVELSFAGNADVYENLKQAMSHREVREAMIITGDTDALVRVRVRDLTHLREVVMALRTSGKVTACTTRVILGRYWQGPPGSENDNADGR